MSLLGAAFDGMLRVPFAHREGKTELVGVEIEAGVVDPATGVSRPYEGDHGVARLLERIAGRWRCDRHSENGHLIGLIRDDGTGIALESGCALEYASVPCSSLASVVAKARRDMAELAEIADGLGLALLSGSMLPFDTPDDVSWAPKARIPLMLDYFDREIGPRSQGWAAMAQILSIQTTLDYLDDDDLAAKYRAANAASALVAALFVNSPIRAGQITGVLSERMRIWTEVDSRRVGYFEHSLDETPRLDDLIDWVAGLPMIFRYAEGRIGAPPPGRSFRDLLSTGFDDATYPSQADWSGMLATTWPYVRLRQTIELRVADGPAQRDWPAATALWVGLLYDPESRDATWDLLGRFTVADHLSAIDDVAVRGLGASIGGTPVRGLCSDLLRLAEQGLARRVAQGAEPEDVLAFLTPLRERVASGVTWAERLAADWMGALGQDPRRYVEAYRYRP